MSDMCNFVIMNMHTYVWICIHKIIVYTYIHADSFDIFWRFTVAKDNVPYKKGYCSMALSLMYVQAPKYLHIYAYLTR